jgi:acetylglutamate kinase
MTHEYAILPTEPVLSAVEALRVTVVKYGGNAMGGAGGGAADTLLAEVATLWQAGEAVVLVHGGGPEIDAALARRGIATTRIAGQRVTDEATLEVTEAVLCGSINKRIVRKLLALGVRAVGVSGQDGGTLIAQRARGENGEDLGFVGEIVAVDTRLIATLLSARYLPVVAPLALARRADHAYNVNADLAAGAIAAGLHARAFVLVTNVPRVLRDLDDPTSVIERLTPDEAASFARSNACRSSMKPKLLAAANAARDGAAAAYICDAKPNAIASALRGDATIVSPP